MSHEEACQGPSGLPGEDQGTGLEQLAGSHRQGLVHGHETDSDRKERLDEGATSSRSVLRQFVASEETQKQQHQQGLAERRLATQEAAVDSDAEALRNKAANKAQARAMKEAAGEEAGSRRSVLGGDVPGLEDSHPFVATCAQVGVRINVFERVRVHLIHMLPCVCVCVCVCVCTHSYVYKHILPFLVACTCYII
jgi:hypothetical protein